VILGEVIYEMILDFKSVVHMYMYICNISYITSYSFLTDSLELTNDQLPTSVAS